MRRPRQLSEPRPRDCSRDRHCRCLVHAKDNGVRLFARLADSRGQIQTQINTRAKQGQTMARFTKSPGNYSLILRMNTTKPVGLQLHMHLCLRLLQKLPWAKPFSFLSKLIRTDRFHLTHKMLETLSEIQRQRRTPKCL